MINLHALHKVCAFLSRSKGIAVALIVTVCTFLLANSCRNYLQSEAAFSKTFKSPDYILQDLYEGAKDTNPIGLVNPNVVIVQDDKCNNAQMAALITAIDSLEPAAIGVDCIFVETGDNPASTMKLVDAINNCKSPLVLASCLEFNDTVKEFTIGSGSALYDLIKGIPSGITNLGSPSISPQSIVRKVQKSFNVGKDSQMNSFAYKLVSCSGMAKEVEDKIPSSIFIRYQGLDTPKFQWNELVLEDGMTCISDEVKDQIKGKIIILGSTNNPTDMHMIPSEKRVSGVEIHAAAIYTIISQNFLIESPRWVDYTIAFVSVFLFALLLYYSSLHWGRLQNLCVRIVQTSMIVAFIIIGYYFYHTDFSPVYIDFSPSIVMIGVSSFVFDIIRGLYGSYLFIKNKMI